jgi:gliding motility-associated-like protein
LKDLIKEGADVNNIDELKDLLDQIRTQEELDDLLEELQNSDGSAITVDDFKDLGLTAITAEEAEKLKDLIKEGADVNNIDELKDLLDQIRTQEELDDLLEELQNSDGSAITVDDFKDLGLTDITAEEAEKLKDLIKEGADVNNLDELKDLFDRIRTENLPTAIQEIFDLGEIVVEWGTNPVLPGNVLIMATNGRPYFLDVTWDQTSLNRFARGNYNLVGSVVEIPGIKNPESLVANLQVIVLPKPAPIDFTLNNSSFEGSVDTFFIPVSGFVVNDPVDNIHTVSLFGDGYDNQFFEIKSNVLFWSSSDRGAGKTKFTIVVRVLDRDGNTLDKFFEITRTRPSVNSIEIFGAFTPGDDNFNNTWGIEELRFYSGVRIQIFESGGLLVFSTNNPDVRWDGTFKGKDMPVGAYFWTVEVGETGEIRKGMLSLIRK